MRKLIVSNIMSLDSYCAGPGKDTSVLPMDGAFDAYNSERLRAADTFLLGRKTYEMFRSFWPTVAEDASASPTNRKISRLMNAMDKLVISNSMDLEQPEPWSNTRVIRRANAHKELAKLKRQTGKDIFVGGSHIMWNDLLANGLVDELHLMVGPVVVGAGTSIFKDCPDVSFRLIGTRKWNGSENVLIRYEVGPKKASRPTKKVKSK
jgi:dihydrofolate reductase